MRTLLRSLAVLSALTLSVLSARATTYTATPTLIDLTNPGNITATFQTSPITFSDPPTSTFTDAFTVCAPDASVNWFGSGSYSDNVELEVSFSSPGNGTGAIGGSDDIDSYFYGIFNDGTITWDEASTAIDLSNGSVVTLSLPTDRRGNVKNIDLQNDGYSCGPNQVCGDSDFALTVTTNDPPIAPTPEPSSLALLGTGILGAAGMLRRKLKV
jgi:hypothetical protein